MYQLAVVIHLLAAITWIGGTLFLVMVMVPLTRRGAIGPPNVSARILGEIARKFRPVAWASIVILALTGLFIAWDQWRISPAEFFTGSGWMVQVLQVKVGFVAIIIVLSIIHDFILGPRVSEMLEGVQTQGPPPEAVRKARRRLVQIARTNVILVLIVVVLGVLMTRGNPF